MRAALVIAALAIACSGTSEPRAGQRTGAGVSTTATKARADDAIVAQVNGRPVWASCVEAQGRGRDARAGLDDCIAFELLAQAAEQRGLATDPEVVDATRGALANRMVETAFEDRYQTPADLGDILMRQVDRNRAWLDIPERRSSAYIRFNLSPKAPAEQDARARELLERLAQQLAPEVGLTAGHLEAIAEAYFPADVKYEVAVVDYFTANGLAVGYREALFDIPEIGRTAPRATRTQWGWDVVLLTGVLPAKKYTREEAAVEAFPEVRRNYFNVWVDQLAKASGMRITRDEKAIAKLDDEAGK